MKIRKYKFATIFSLIILAVMLIAFIPFNSIFSSASAVTDESFIVDVYGRGGNMLLKPPTTEFNGGNAYIFNWKDVSKFVLNIDTSKKTPPFREEGGTPYYTATIKIEYLKGYAEYGGWGEGAFVSFENLPAYTKIVRGTDSHLNLSEFKPEFNIDEGITSESLGSTQTAKGWGIYKFTLDINSQQTESEYFIIEPTKEVANDPAVTFTTVVSDTSIRDAYQFSLTNAEEYKYIDTNKLVWYAKGQTLDGKIYAYSKSDIGTPKFTDCGNNYLYDNPSRTGLTFLFDDSGKYGKWDVWCEYRPEAPGNPRDGVTTTIETKADFNYVIIIVIVTVIATIAIAFTVGVSIFKIKKEKVY